MIRIRVDDYPFVKPEEVDRHSRQAFSEFHETIRKHTRAKYLLGVIPSRLGYSAYVDPLLDATEAGIVVGMHGINHDERFPNEFRDHMTVVDRTNALVDARKRLSDLCGQDVVHYIPPHNCLDGRTYQALEKAGFKHVYGGPGTVYWPPKNIGFDFHYSAEPLEYGRSDELLQRGSVRHLWDKDEVVYLTLHWTWENNIELEHLDRYLAQISPLIEDIE